MQLCKWASKSDHALLDLETDRRAKSMELVSIPIEKEGKFPVIKTWGLIWQMTADTCHFEQTLLPLKMITWTRQELLSMEARLFDPLGLGGQGESVSSPDADYSQIRTPGSSRFSSVDFIICLNSNLDESFQEHETDWTNALRWLRNQSQDLKTFLAHRAAHIQRESDKAQWKYVPTSKKRLAALEDNGVSNTSCVCTRSDHLGVESST